MQLQIRRKTLTNPTDIVSVSHGTKTGLVGRILYIPDHDIQGRGGIWVSDIHRRSSDVGGEGQFDLVSRPGLMTLRHWNVIFRFR